MRDTPELQHIPQVCAAHALLTLNTCKKGMLMRYVEHFMWHLSTGRWDDIPDAGMQQRQEHAYI